jgi:hypothetical protein
MSDVAASCICVCVVSSAGRYVDSGCSLFLQLLSGSGDVFMRMIYIPMHSLVHIPFIFILCPCRSAENHHLGILTFSNLLHPTIKKATQVNLILCNFYISVYGLVKDFN